MRTEDEMRQLARETMLEQMSTNENVYRVQFTLEVGHGIRVQVYAILSPDYTWRFE